MPLPRRTIPLLLAALTLPIAAFALSRALGPTRAQDLGADPRDDAALADSPYLAHLAQALPPGDHRVRDLLGEAPLPYRSPPSPGALLEGMRAENLARPAIDAALPLTLMTYNLGLLDRPKILGIFGRVQVPEIGPRRAAMADALLKEGRGIYLLQEVWEPEDSEAIRQAAQLKGYLTYGGTPEHQPEHGLLILIHPSLVNGAEDLAMGEHQYQPQYGLEFWPGPGIRRGYLWLSFTHPTLGPIRVVNTHLTAFPAHWRTRALQSRELALDLEAKRRPGELVFLGGDLNAGPYYAQDLYTRAGGETEGGWWANAQSYALLLYYLHAKDLFAMGADSMDIPQADALQMDPARFEDAPFGVPGYCEGHPHLAFTATDCNTLYRRNYGGTELPARLDHLFVRDPEGRVRVTSARLAFTEPMDLPGGVHAELSDHYAVEVRVEVTPLGYQPPPPETPIDGEAPPPSPSEAP